MLNPYESPNQDRGDTNQEGQTSPQRNHLAYIGFFTSLAGVLAELAVGRFDSWIGIIPMYVAFASLPGLIISGIALFHKPRRLAGWGVVLGLFGSLNLSTICAYLFLMK